MNYELYARGPMQDDDGSRLDDVGYQIAVPKEVGHELRDRPKHGDDRQREGEGDEQCHLVVPVELIDNHDSVDHNILGVDKQALLRETFRVLKKGGSFAIHDVMAEYIYGDMQKFAEELRADGFEEVNLIPTDNGKFMTKREGRLLLLSGSMILTGRK